MQARVHGRVGGDSKPCQKQHPITSPDPTRPSHVSACNIENWVRPGYEASTNIATRAGNKYIVSFSPHCLAVVTLNKFLSTFGVTNITQKFWQNANITMSCIIHCRQLQLTNGGYKDHTQSQGEWSTPMEEPLTGSTGCC